MNINDFINQQVKMINNNFGLEEIKDNVIKYHSSNTASGNLINKCMGTYADIIKRHSKLCKECGDVISIFCHPCMLEISQGITNKINNQNRNNR